MHPPVCVFGFCCKSITSRCHWTVFSCEINAYKKSDKVSHSAVCVWFLNNYFCPGQFHSPSCDSLAVGWCKSNSRTGNLLLFHSAVLLNPLSGQTPPHSHFRLYHSITLDVVIPNFQTQDTSKTISPLFCKAPTECWWDTASRVGGFPAQVVQNAS